MYYRSYTSAGKWYEDAKKEGYTPSCSMMHGITRTMEELNMTFPKAFEFLEKTKKLFLVDKLYYFKLDYEKLFDLAETERSLLIHVFQIIELVQAKEGKVLKIYWQINSTPLFDFIKSELSDKLTENVDESSILITHGTQYVSPTPDIQSGDLSPKYAIVLAFSIHSHVIVDRGSLYILEDGKYNHIPSVQVPNKQWAKYFTKVTGKPEMETWLQGMFLLTEIEGFSQEEAQKFMEENWDK